MGFNNENNSQELLTFYEALRMEKPVPVAMPPNASHSPPKRTRSEPAVKLRDARADLRADLKKFGPVPQVENRVPLSDLPPNTYGAIPKRSNACSKRPLPVPPTNKPESRSKFKIFRDEAPAATDDEIVCAIKKSCSQASQPISAGLGAREVSVASTISQASTGSIRPLPTPPVSTGAPGHRTSACSSTSSRPLPVPPVGVLKPSRSRSLSVSNPSHEEASSSIGHRRNTASLGQKNVQQQQLFVAVNARPAATPPYFVPNFSRCGSTKTANPLTQRAAKANQGQTPNEVSKRPSTTDHQKQLNLAAQVRTFSQNVEVATPLSPQSRTDRQIHLKNWILGSYDPPTPFNSGHGEGEVEGHADELWGLDDTMLSERARRDIMRALRSNDSGIRRPMPGRWPTDNSFCLPAGHETEITVASAEETEMQDMEAEIEKIRQHFEGIQARRDKEKRREEAEREVSRREGMRRRDVKVTLLRERARDMDGK